MNEFNKREEGFEKKFALDEELKFKAEARRNKLLGLWAAEKLGITGDAANGYAKEVVAADFEEAGDNDVLHKVLKDLTAMGPADTAREVRAMLLALGAGGAALARGGRSAPATAIPDTYFSGYLLQCDLHAHRAAHVETLLLLTVLPADVDIDVDRFEPAILCHHLAQQVALARRHFINGAASAVAQLLCLLAVTARPRQEQVDVALDADRPFLADRNGLLDQGDPPARSLRESRSRQEQQADGRCEQACHRRHGGSLHRGNETRF